MVEPKGVRFIVDLWRHPSLQNKTLIMAGQGPLADELRGKSPPNVQWVGQIEGARKQELFATCRAIVFPCLWAEPLSTVAYEAYERGKPILASNMGGMKEIILDRITGRLLPPGHTPAWLEALNTLGPDESGSKVAVPIFRRFMAEAMHNQPALKFTRLQKEESPERSEEIEDAFLS